MPETTQPRRIVIIDGHPDRRPERFVHALTENYARAASRAGHPVRRIDIARLDIPLVETRDQWERGKLSEDIARAQDSIAWAEHLLIAYPLWLGDMPALLKAFFEQIMRPGFAFAPRKNGMPEKKLAGRSARLVVTMGMPALFYRAYYGAHSVKSLERNILKFVGIQPLGHLIIGNVEGSAKERASWLEKLAALGEAGV